MKINKLLLTLATIAITLCASAQTSSPYSRFGFGLLQDNATSAQRAMGGVGYAMNSGRQINVMNPASYAAIDSLTFLFDMGISATALWSEEDGNKGKDFGGGLDYITMQFPISKHIGASVGLLPYSSVGYSFGHELVHGSASREGAGGLNQLYAGISGRIFKGFSIGTNVSYLFGTSVYDSYAYTSTGATSLFERVMQVRDWHIQFGAQYSFDIDRKNRLSLGVVYTPGKTLLGKTWATKYDINADAAPDTVSYSKLKGNYSLPDAWGAGINYQWDNRLMVEVDFTYQAWKDAKTAAMYNEEGAEIFEKPTYDNRWEVSAGLQYTPKLRGNYAQRIQYRVGGFYNNDYIVVNNNNVREYGVTAGLGLPVNGLKTVINIGFEYRHRQAHPNPLIKEDYLGITVGVNFNELWFWQNKIR